MFVITYQIAAVCIFVLFAQVFASLNHGDKKRKWCTLNISNGSVGHIEAGWNTNYLSSDLGYVYILSVTKHSSHYIIIILIYK